MEILERSLGLGKVRWVRFAWMRLLLGEVLYEVWFGVAFLWVRFKFG